MQYDKTFKEEAVRLSEDIGVKNAASQLGIHYYTLYGWRKEYKKYGSSAYLGSGHKRKVLTGKDQRILELEKENNELKHSNEILKEALGFFAVRRKK